MIRRKSTIDQHVGTHPETGLRMTRLHEVVTEYDFDASNRERCAWVDQVHAARVQLELLDYEARLRAYDWLADHDHDPDAAAVAIRRAIVVAIT